MRFSLNEFQEVEFLGQRYIYWAEGMTQEVEHLCSKPKALSQTLIPQKGKEVGIFKILSQMWCHMPI
jgi:hypothetical protein